jgi:hypothetical protein
MSYDVFLNDPVTGEVIHLDEPHHMRGGTYCVGGTADLRLNITWNYADHYYRLFPPEPKKEGQDCGLGIRWLYGRSAVETIPVIQGVIDQLGDDVTDNYWDGTEGNAKRALVQLVTMARMRPDGVWAGD